MWTRSTGGWGFCREGARVRSAPEGGRGASPGARFQSPVKVRVFVRLKEGILDPQGVAVQRALEGLGYREVRDLRVGKVLELELTATDSGQARARLEEMCVKLLANPVTEDFTVEIIPEAGRSRLP